MFTRCPKCGHGPLPADQALPAACPACGVILAKVAQALREVAAESSSSGVDSLSFWLRVSMLAAIGLWLFGVSLRDVAPYMVDALDP